MGIDAEMFVRTKAKVTVEEVREWAYRLGEAFGPDNFWIWKDEGKVRHCLELIEVYEQDGPDIKPKRGETFIQVHPTSRFYGPGYERGDLPFLTAIAEWIEANIPGAEVWYGGDSSGVEAIRFNKATRQKFLQHFYKHGHSPYHRFDDLLSKDGPEAPLCKCCWKRMRQFGWGQNYAAFNCDGCGESVVTKDGGKTFTPHEDGWEVAVGRPFSCPECKNELVTRDAGKTFATRNSAEKIVELEKKRKKKEKKSDG